MKFMNAKQPTEISVSSHVLDLSFVIHQATGNVPSFMFAFNPQLKQLFFLAWPAKAGGGGAGGGHGPPPHFC